MRDGLKPVQRRTLYDMHELGIRYDKPYRKSARIVGYTMGKYHPHGDSSIYDLSLIHIYSKVADMLRRSHKPVVLVVNKVDSFEKYMTDVYGFYNLDVYKRQVV